MTTSTLPPDHAARMDRAALAIDGLSVGDALGETCFRDNNRDRLMDDPRRTAAGPWPYTDDTEMALGIREVLQRHGRIDQADLAATFARRWQLAPWRGYGAGAFQLLGLVAAGADWRAAAETMFGGQGSFGNGSAMRVAPVAGYFAADGFETVADQAALSAAVTHAHPEGIAGGVAAAVAGAYAWANRDRRGDEAVKRGLFAAVLAHARPGDVWTGIRHAATIAFDVSIEAATRLLGNGSRISCQDTVPFCLWVAARHLDDYQTAIVETIRGGGDIDTNAAIVGGIVALAAGPESIPDCWLEDREALKLRL
ncbi:MAG: crystallin [Gemmataceae bacterium]|nr:crystallin [Gemmataceae bacterium]